MDRIEWATWEGQPVELWRGEAPGLEMEVSNYGATLTRVRMPDRSGRWEDIALGFDAFEEYLHHRLFLGATAGRVANRIRGGKFTLEGKSYQLDKNDPPHHLHGGEEGWDRVLWKARPFAPPEGVGVELVHRSPAGEGGYPGTVEARVRYTLEAPGTLTIEMLAAALDGVTLVNLAHHSYWNLGGPGAEDILRHELQLESDEYTVGDPVPTGEVRRVEGTPFDFRQPKRIGADLAATAAESPPGAPVGYDHNWIVRGEPAALRRVARLVDPSSGRCLALEANAPGVQFYSGNFLDSTIRDRDRLLGQHCALCLETQAFPNAINVPPWQSQVILRPGQPYQHKMVHRFSVLGS